jgi:hypothetical protein
MVIAFADNITSAGDRYWRIINPAESKPLTPPIWAGEISWLIGSLERIAATLDPAEYPDDDLAYPIEFLFRGTDAVVLLFDHRDGVPRLRFERWKGTWVNQETDQTQVRRYFGPGNRSAFGQLMLGQGWADHFRSLVLQFREAATDDRNRHWAEYHDQRKETPTNPPSPERVIVRADRVGQVIGLPWTPFFGSFVEATVLDRPLLERLLEICKGGSTADEIAANLDRQLDARHVGQLLTWSARYYDDALSGAYFLRIDAGSDMRPLFSATRDPEGFAADPLLIDLAEFPLDLPSSLAGKSVIPTPQFPLGMPLDSLLERKVISGVFTTPWGALPRPTLQRASATRRVAGLPATMNRFRWWMLQLLDLSAAALVNLPPTNPIQMILALQRVALLAADCRATFAAFDDQNKKVEDLCLAAGRNYINALQRKTARAGIRRKADLP